jgi:acyl-coenzyme A synthetase/AMP-(fatty) acid ligase
VSYKHLVGGIAFVDAIPRNPSGKLLRRLLRGKAKEVRQKLLEETSAAKTRL